MSSSASLRLAPSRHSVRSASIWRFWKQGDEFYAAVRDAIHATKVSFHRNGNWQVRVGPATQRLTPTRLVGPNWRHVIAMHWLLWRGAFVPKPRAKEQCTLVDVPEQSKLVVNLLLSVGKSTDSEPAATVWKQRLRGGTVIAVQAITLPQTEHDVSTALRLRSEAVIGIDRMPDRGDFYAEIAWFSARAEGNAVAIVPLGPDSLKARDVSERAT